MKTQNNFNVSTIDLEGSKLVEASAGTGKTYSVAILVLRLILARNIPVDKILMVTFTVAAAAELEARIRKFVRLAYKYARGEDIKDATIREAVDNSNEEKLLRLKKAVQSLDNLSVMTIHSFCQKTINEFTFETNQSFDFEIVSDDTFLFHELVNVYRREVVNTIENFEWFQEINSYLKFDRMSDILRKSLAGKKFLDIDLTQHEDLNVAVKRYEGALTILKEQINTNFNSVTNTRIRANARLAKNRENPEQFLPVFIQDCCMAGKYTEEFAFLYEPYGRVVGEAYKQVRHAFYTTFINSASATIQKIKQEKGLISYDDQIRTVYNALENEDFVRKLAGEYKAVFIDEFQDTDKHQYEIFRKVFTEGTGDADDKPVIFYIGDPKQSIYGWRSADLDTYKKAKTDVGESVYTMNKNYRSTKDMIDALNVLLDPGGNFNMFEDEKIRYLKVEQGATNLGIMSENDKKVLPVTVWRFDENDEKTNFRLVAEEAYRLLTDNVKIKGAKIAPGDIGILVRDNREGDNIKAELAKFNIPAVKRDNAKVLKSKEAGMIRTLIVAVLSPTRGDINRALNSTWFGFDTLSLNKIDDEQHIELFIGLRLTLNEEGIYNMISSFLDIYGVRTRCMKDITGQRVLTNINQIAELLHAAEKTNKYTPSELVTWLDRSMDNDDDDFEQRIESDENAVQISTIHKAKGLEYKIVFAPCLSMIPKAFFLKRGQLNEFKKGNDYLFTLNYPDLSDDDRRIFNLQKEQENRRLVYVALTRAIYKCYISLVPMGTAEKPASSSLSAIIDRYKGNSDLIEILDRTKNDINRQNRKYIQTMGTAEFRSKPLPAGLILKNTFGIHSYSALSRAHHSAPFEKAELGNPEDYDQFIFQDLGRGANVGTALHSIFERLNFSKPDTWIETIHEASKYYPNVIKKKDNEKKISGNIELIHQMVTNVMKAEINSQHGRFRLCDIDDERKLPELEFCFSVDRVNKQVINDYLGDDAKLGGETDIEGLMTGYVDLVFEHKEKYYILDWKSNHLGNDLENYETDGLKAAMIGSNYHLQYMIYTVALKRWLEKKIANFDFNTHFGGVVYVFLRGARENRSTGIYYKNPGIAGIEKIDSALGGNIPQEV